MKTARKRGKCRENQGSFRSLITPDGKKKSLSSAPNGDSSQSHLLLAIAIGNPYKKMDNYQLLPWSLLFKISRQMALCQTFFTPNMLPLQGVISPACISHSSLHFSTDSFSKLHWSAAWLWSYKLQPSRTGTCSLIKVKYNLSAVSKILCHTTGLPDQHQVLHCKPGRNKGEEGFWRRMATLLEICVELLFKYEE